MRQKKILLMILIVSNLFIVTLSHAQMGNGWISGRIIEEGTNKQIAGADVFYTVNTVLRRGVVSDSDGKFITDKFQAGQILILEVKAEGYYTHQEEVILQDGATDVLVEMTNIQKAKAIRDQKMMEEEKKLAMSKPIAQTFNVINRDARRIFELVQSISCARSASSELQTITAYGSLQDLKKLEELIKTYDTPLKQIWLEVLLIKATGNGGGKPKYPQEIDSIVSKLRSLFKFGEYAIIGRGNAMALEGAMLSFSGRIENDPNALVTNPFNVQAGIASAGDVIKLQNLKVVIARPQNEIRTSINIKNGETVILGASRGKSGEDALITVVTAKIME